MFRPKDRSSCSTRVCLAQHTCSFDKLVGSATVCRHAVALHDSDAYLSQPAAPTVAKTKLETARNVSH